MILHSLNLLVPYCLIMLDLFYLTSYNLTTILLSCNLIKWGFINGKCAISRIKTLTPVSWVLSIGLRCEYIPHVLHTCPDRQPPVKEIQIYLAQFGF